MQNPPPCLPTYPSAFTAYIIWRQLPPTLYLAYLYSYALANLNDLWMSCHLGILFLLKSSNSVTRQKAKDLSRIPFCQAQSLMLIWIKHLLNKDSGRMKDCVEAHCWHHYSDLPHYYLLLFRTGQSLTLSNRKHDWNFTPTHIKIFLHTSPATPP